MQERLVLDRLTRLTLERVESDAPITPSILTFLLHMYAATGQEDLETALGMAMARTLDALERLSTMPDESDEADGAAWLALCADAARLSDDPRLRTRASMLAQRERAGWTSSQDGTATLRSVEACLRAADVLDGGEETSSLIVAAIDELEHVVTAGYRPGAGIVQGPGQPNDGRSIDDQVAAASVLLTAYEVTGRLPYSMLAEELMQGLKSVEIQPGDRFVRRCETVSVLCRLVLLHRDADYRERAVLAATADYESQADELLEGLAAEHEDRDLSLAAAFGTALLNRLGLVRTESGLEE